MDDNNPIEFETVRKWLNTGELWQKTKEELNRCLRGLAINAEPNAYIRHHYIIIASVIQSILLSRLLDEQERRNQRNQRVIMLIASITVIATIIQIIVAVLN